jgi:hypothetical protein
MALRNLPPSCLTDALDAGSAAFAARWRAWMGQFTQPQLLRISDAYLGARLFHSSQMGGFSSRKLRQPGPLVFCAVGYVNVAHARSIGIPAKRIDAVTDIGLPQKLPGALSKDWEDKYPLTDAKDIVMGPAGLFEAFCGFRPLIADDQWTLTLEQEPIASATLGKLLRMSLAAKGIDWLTEIPQLRSRSSVIEPLLLGKAVSGYELIQQLPQLAAIAGTTKEALWAQIESAL